LTRGYAGARKWDPAGAGALVDEADATAAATGVGMRPKITGSSPREMQALATELHVSVCAMPEVVEAAARCGDEKAASAALDLLCERTGAAA